MRRSMLDILACPIDKYYPLELFEIDTTIDTTINETVIKEEYSFVHSVQGFILLLKKFLLCCQTNYVTKKKILNF